MLQLVRRLLLRTPPIKIQHPVFGGLLLQQGKKGPYWLREAYADGDFTVAIDILGNAEPTEDQVAFYQGIVGSPEAVYRRASTELSMRHQQMHGKPVSSDWRQTFRLASIDVPLKGDALLSREITFECLTDKSGFLYTCHYENDNLVHVSVDT